MDPSSSNSVEGLRCRCDGRRVEECGIGETDHVIHRDDDGADYYLLANRYDGRPICRRRIGMMMG
jgi:hypothetical protein